MTMNAYPEPTVGALIFNPNKELLLVKSMKWNDRYAIPGGHIELGENIEDALRREILEETGLCIYDLRLLGLQQCVFDKSFHEKKHFIFIDFVCKTDCVDVILNEEHQDFRWVKLEELDKYSLEPYTKKLVQEYRRGKTSRFGKKILYDYYQK